MKKSTFTGNLMLLLCAVIWGLAFVAQSEAMDSMGPLAFQMARSILGGAVLLPIIFFSDFSKKKIGIYKERTAGEKKKTLFTGILCGAILCAASLLQQYGIALGTSAGNAGFITALYILLVPVASLIFFKKKVSPALWVCIAFALLGLWFICIKGEIKVSLSDTLVLACAFVFAAHITVVDRFAKGLDGVRISCIQFFTGAVISAIAMFIFEKPDLSQFTSGIIPILYAGIMSSGVAYTLQILGQQRTDGTVASLIMSLESVFAVLGAIGLSLIKGTGEFPTIREIIGSVIMLATIIAAQLL